NAFTLTTTFTDTESAVTSCAYTLDGSTWSAAVVSGAGPTYTCTKTGLTGTNGQLLSLNMRATSGGGTATATAITRTLDAAPPTDGPLIATPGNAQVVLTWSGFADAGSGLAVYKVVWSDITPTVSCTGNAFGYSGTSTSFTHSGLVN